MRHKLTTSFALSVVLLAASTFASPSAQPADAGNPATYCSVVLDGPYHDTFLWYDHARANAVAGCTWPVKMSSYTELRLRAGFSYRNVDTEGGSSSYAVSAKDSVSHSCDHYDSTYQVKTSWTFTESLANSATLGGSQTNRLNLC